MVKWIDTQIDGQIHGQMDRYKDNWIDTRIDTRKDTWKNGQMNRLKIHGQMDRYMDRWKDTWIERKIHGQMNKLYIKMLFYYLLENCKIFDVVGRNCDTPVQGDLHSQLFKQYQKNVHRCEVRGGEIWSKRERDRERRKCCGNYGIWLASGFKKFLKRGHIKGYPV